MSGLSLIGITTCSKQVGLHAFHIRVECCKRAFPLIIPSPISPFDPAIILDGQDGIRVTRSFSCTRPFHDAGPAFFAVAAHYPAREASLLL
ncbi:glutamine amidotransferase [Pseudomonas extremaustralis]|uniref:Gamma-glutamyl-gamma-aminobutyrate hydrolase family protein n=1 Tax=Pseudomonas extremaustralis TaxID=359110 RepID=A0A5C5QIX5_9PSED|nr:glutamine amidotransferase [Pseudomonas extremaustralis]MDB1110694.1 glutamine amidotransferase [Pseudomonas extremaustralis]MDF3132988.1 glutamine amidotransferase [Pseudomonas extremaustralis]MDG2966526.1 glutamine amidotransferase [Pseudomonas extremaustralis]TWS05265.1 gamma-glutamyl-gamma-aminobutyrate hydrolase family protein [Pseudomonas extremaustralis]UUJ38292.1 gamma-glutamyl-gamma-aminobutyrate hydrolase family protein [Pseudomonas extremaustralis]